MRVRHGTASAMLAVTVTGLVSACTLLPSPSAPSSLPSPTPARSPSTTTTPPATAAPASAGPTAGLTATPEPPLSLDLPDEADERRISVSVQPDVPPDGDGLITVEVVNLADSLIDEIVVRWPTDLGDTLFLAPFRPSEDRIRDGGPPLVQPWTKWVVGPGEQGEPDGTTSLGYGPLPAESSLTIPIVVTRVSSGAVAFDLQVLAHNDLLTLEDGSPAELRVEVP